MQTIPATALRLTKLFRWFLWAMVLITVTAVVFSGLTITKYPLIFVDEGWFSNSAWNWVVNGVPFDTMHSGPLDQFGHAWIRRNVVAEAIWSLGFKLIGVGFAQARFISWVIGLGVLAAAFGAAYRLYDLPTALLTIVLVATSQIFLHANHLARQDILLAFVGLTGFGLSAWALKNNVWWAHLLGGFLIGLSISIHQNGICYVLGLGSMYLVSYGRSLLANRGTWLAAAGGLGGVALFLILHILPNPEVYFLTLSLNLSKTHVLPLLEPTKIPLSILREIVTIYQFHHNLLAFALIGIGTITLLLRRHAQDNHLLAFTIGSWLGFALLVGNKSYLYAITLYPFMMLIIAAAILHWIRETKRPGVQLIAGLAAAALIAFNLFTLGKIYLTYQSYNYTAITERINAAIPPGSRVMGMPNWWFGFAHGDYRSNFTYNFYNHLNDLSFDEAMALVQPDYFIVDYSINLLLAGEDEILPDQFDAYSIPRGPFETMLAERGTLVLTFEDPWHAGFEIYALNWDDK